MSTAIAKNFQIGADSTPSNNFTLYQPASPDGTVRLGNGNTGITSSLVTVTSAGNVGIGATSGLDRLTVRNDQNASTRTAISNQDAGSSAESSLRLSASGATWDVAAGSTAKNSNALTFGVIGAEFMRITSGGNVGIGTTSPANKLHVAGGVTLGDYGNIGATNNNAGISLTGGSATNNGGQINLRGGSFSGNTSGIEFLTNGTQRANIDSSGNFQFNSGYGSVATAFGCRAWVNFNGTGTVAIRGSGNVSSITDNGTGDYTVNFATAMPDANYAITGTGMTTNQETFIGRVNAAPVAGSCRILVFNRAGSVVDTDFTNVAVFR